jgi:hypothetical protein
MSSLRGIIFSTVILLLGTNSINPLGALPLTQVTIGSSAIFLTIAR